MELARLGIAEFFTAAELLLLTEKELLIGACFFFRYMTPSRLGYVSSALGVVT